MLGSAETRKVRLISCEIIFEEFQRVWSQSSPPTSQTDGRTTYHGITALRYASTLRAVMKENDLPGLRFSLCFCKFSASEKLSYDISDEILIARIAGGEALNDLDLGGEWITGNWVSVCVTRWPVSDERDGRPPANNQTY